MHNLHRKSLTGIDALVSRSILKPLRPSRRLERPAATKLRWPWLSAAPGLGLAMFLVCTLDRRHPSAGLVLLVVMVATVGMLHGALDALLLTRQWPGLRSRAAVALSYLLAVVATALLLQPRPGLALVLLLALSIWHFGEGFELNQALPTWQSWAFRLLRGGAPVLLPALVARPALQSIVARLVGPEMVASVAATWTVAAVAWLLLACILTAHTVYSWPSAPRALRVAAIETSALTALYLLLSPMMAFALFFGLYHSLGHTARVSSLTPGHGSWRSWVADPALALTLLLTLLLGVGLVLWMGMHRLELTATELTLRTVVLALTAVSVPHVLFISYWARRPVRPPSA